MRLGLLDQDERLGAALDGRTVLGVEERRRGASGARGSACPFPRARRREAGLSRRGRRASPRGSRWRAPARGSAAAAVRSTARRARGPPRSARAARRGEAATSPRTSGRRSRRSGGACASPRLPPDPPTSAPPGAPSAADGSGAAGGGSGGAGPGRPAEADAQDRVSSPEGLEGARAPPGGGRDPRGRRGAPTRGPGSPSAVRVADDLGHDLVAAVLEEREPQRDPLDRRGARPARNVEVERSEEGEGRARDRARARGRRGRSSSRRSSRR